jgi:ABC-type branched-subunit amino acid transport system permease subunit
VSVAAIRYARLARPPRVAWRLMPWVGALAATSLVPLLLSGFWTGIAATVVIYACVFLSITVITGFAGEISLGQVAFMGVGAYASAGLTNRLGLPVFAAAPLAGLCAVPVSLLIGLASVRLRGLTLAIVTLLFSTTMASFVFRNPDVIGKISVQKRTAADALSGVRLPRPHYHDQALSNDAYFWMTLLFLLALVVIVRNVRDGRMGRLFVAVRESEETVWAMGSSVVTVKLVAFAFSAFIAGVGGALYGHYSGTVSWVDFDTIVSVIFFALAAVAGLSSIPGAALAGALYVLPPQLFIQVHMAWLNRYYFVMAGVLLVGVTIYLPGGLVALPARLVSHFSAGKAQDS